MSIRAYIVREKKIFVDEENMTFQYDNNGPEDLVKYTREELEYAFNIWHQQGLIEKLIDFGAEDYTNNEYIGEIEMGKEDFESMMEQSSFSEEDLGSMEVIQKYFDEGWNWLILKCM